MHSKALIEMHCFNYIAESLDTLRLNHEIAGNAGSEKKCAEVGGEVLGMMCREGGEAYSNVQNHVEH